MRRGKLTWPNCHCESPEGWNLFHRIRSSVFITAIPHRMKMTKFSMMMFPEIPRSYAVWYC